MPLSQTLVKICVIAASTRISSRCERDQCVMRDKSLENLKVFSSDFHTVIAAPEIVSCCELISAFFFPLRIVLLHIDYIRKTIYYSQSIIYGTSESAETKKKRIVAYTSCVRKVSKQTVSRNFKKNYLFVIFDFYRKLRDFDFKFYQN